MNQFGQTLLAISVVIITALLLFSTGTNAWYTWKVIAFVLAVIGTVLQIAPLIRK